jgi:hypothetical protein
VKIRSGFVSNSSTSSFCMFGVMLDSCDESFYDKIKDLGLDLDLESTDWATYIGKSWASIKDDQTGAEFKQDIENKVAKLLGKNATCKTYEEAWHD